MDPYIIDTLMPDLVGHDRRPGAYVVYLYVWAGRHHRRTSASYAEIAGFTGLSKRTVQTAVQHLERRRLITVERTGTTASPSYIALLPWHRRKRR
jgi:DNA-binding MarR family transcriptional regulator